MDAPAIVAARGPEKGSDRFHQKPSIVIVEWSGADVVLGFSCDVRAAKPEYSDQNPPPR